MEFKTVRKGYDKKEVDGFLAKSAAETDRLLKEKQTAIDELKAQLDEKQKKLDEFEAKTKKISEAILVAIGKAEEIERLSVYKYNQEMEQLKSFHARWLTYYARLMKKYPLTEDLEAVKTFNDKVTRILGATETDSSSERFREEFSRLIKQNGVLDGDEVDDIPSVAPATFIKLEEDKPAAKPTLADTPSESGFSFEEALNPKQSLEEIMADLGLLMDEAEGKND